MTVTETIKAVMLERGVTQAELSTALGMSRTHLARMLRAPDHNYTVRMLQRIAAALGTTLNITFEGEDI